MVYPPTAINDGEEFQRRTGESRLTVTRSFFGKLPAALRGRAEISFGNVVGSIMEFFLFNDGIIALASPVHVSSQVLQFYLPVMLVTVLFLSLVMLRKRVPRWAGAIFVLLYLLFVAGGYVPL
ncbi:hypothetical protein [Haladaptatus sp. AB618]|uniref:hypothetical protein n=1 Tax=Haladaptatus sp. AB618 TaxID=2934173 RepID=UPI0034E986FD